MVQQKKINSGSTSDIYYKNGIDCLRKVVKYEGYRGLYSGLSVNLVRGFSGSILLVGYDEIKSFIHKIV